MYDPINLLVKENATTEDVFSVLSETIHGISGIADVLYSGDLTATDESTINDLGSALLLLNGIVNSAISKLCEQQDENHKLGVKK